MENVTVAFETSYGNPRYGFTHVCTALSSEGRSATVSIHYINRTWEAHPFDTAKKCAIDKLIHQEIEEDCRNYKLTHRCNGRLPKGYRKECEKIYRQKYQYAYDRI